MPQVTQLVGDGVSEWFECKLTPEPMLILKSGYTAFLIVIWLVYFLVPRLCLFIHVLVRDVCLPLQILSLIFPPGSVPQEADTCGLHRWAFLSPSFQLGLASGSQQETREKKESSQGIYSPGSLPLQPLWAGYLPQPKAKVASSTQGSGFQYLLPHLHLSDPWVFTVLCPALPPAASLYPAQTLWTVPSSDPSRIS